MKILIVGASGATGRLVAEQLLEQGHFVKAIVRSVERLPEVVRNHQNLLVVEAAVLDLSDDELRQHVEDCEGVVSCLGHNLTVKGIYGHPRKLVTDAVQRLCGAIKANGAAQRTKFVLMNTTGNRNRDLDEPISFAESCVIGLLRLLMPPHTDNEDAADYLRTQIGQEDGLIEWVAVRPDTLINEDAVSAYDVHPSPTRSAIFNAGKSSRINVAHFMTVLLTDNENWRKWKGQMPVLYNNSI